VPLIKASQQSVILLNVMAPFSMVLPSGKNNVSRTEQRPTVKKWFKRSNRPIGVITAFLRFEIFINFRFIDYISHGRKK
jgi:hypothetical protein